MTPTTVLPHSVLAGGSDFDGIADFKRKSGGRVTHLTPEERVERGKAARREVPRSAHAAFAPPPDRPDPVDLLERQAATRVRELVPIRYGRMLTSPFAFYRGAALIMAADLAGTPSSGLPAQLCGDAHLANFGTYGSPERKLVFDINDFDETNPGPWEWDVKRLATSFEVAARDNGFAAKDRDAVVLRVGAAYRKAMAKYSTMRNLDVWYVHIPVDEILARIESRVDRAMLKRINKDLPKARARDSLHALEKLTVVVDGRRRIVSEPPLIMPIEELAPDDIDRDAIEDAARDLLRAYRQTLPADRRVLLESFEYVSLGRKVVGVGSVGTRAWIALLQGRDGGDPLFLQFKQAERSVLEDYAEPSRFGTSGERVVAGQRIMQATSDVFLGWIRAVGTDGNQRDYYARQLRDWKGSAPVEVMDPVSLGEYARLCGVTLARAHARSGDRIAIAAYLGTSDAFDRALATFAAAYADQNEADHATLQKAVADGRVTALTGL